MRERSSLGWLASTLGEGVKVSAPVQQVGVTAAAGGGSFG